MASPQWYQFHVTRWRGSTKAAKMNLGERGAYREMLDYQCLQPNGMIPNEPELFWQFVRCKPEEWETVKAAVLSMFREVTEDGKSFLVNDTMYEVWQHAQESYRKLAEAGARGGRAKANKRVASIATASLEHRSSKKVADLDLDLDKNLKPSADKSAVKPTKENKPKEKPDPRRKDFLALMDSHIKATIRREVDRPAFHPNVTVATDRFLAANDKLAPADFCRWLDNRAKSDKVNFTQSVHTWLKTLNDYAQGPLDEWRKPKRMVRASAPEPALNGNGFVDEQRRKRELATAERGGVA